MSAAEKQAQADRRAAIVARAKANPNASDKGNAGDAMVEGVRDRVRKKQSGSMDAAMPADPAPMADDGMDDMDRPKYLKDEVKI